MPAASTDWIVEEVHLERVTNVEVNYMTHILEPQAARTSNG